MWMGFLTPLREIKYCLKWERKKYKLPCYKKHLNSLEHEKLKRMGFSKIFYSSYKSGHRRGVATLISQGVPFELISETTDKEGRFSLITGRTDGIQITLLNVYAPPDSDISFYRKLFDLMAQSTGILICGGDWNVRLNSRLDSSRQIPQTSLQKKIKILMSEYGIVDICRDLYPTSWDYTHFSHAHTVYSRIDYFFIFKRDRHRVCNCEIGNIDLSDHAPLLLNVEINDDFKNIQWRLNTSVLNDLQFTKLIKSDIKTFLKENLNGEVSPEIVWDTLKAIMRGKIISFCVQKKRARQYRLSELNRELKELEGKHKREFKPELNIKLKILRNN